MEALSWVDEAMRGVSIACCLLSLYWLVRRRKKYWKKYDKQMRDVWWSLAGWTVVGAYSNIESLWLMAVPGPRILLTMIVSIFTLRLIYRLGPLVASFEAQQEHAC